MSQDILREYLVSLGFRINGAQDFTRGVEAVNLTVTKMADAAVVAADAMKAAVLKISENLESLYFASQRTQASADNIKAFGFAMGQLGGSAQGAQEAIEGLARFMRNSPGGEGLVRSLGIPTRDDNGHLRDTEQILEDIGNAFKKMPYYRANAYAGLFGIDEKTLQAMIRDTGEFGQRYRDMIAAVGLNSQEATRVSHEFWNNLRQVAAFMELLSMRIVARLEDALGDLITWFKGLDSNGKLAVVSLGGITAAMVLLNSTFLRSPIGIIFLLGAAIFALYDDYKTWQEGGKSLIDWNKWKPGIDAATKGVNALGACIRVLLSYVNDLADKVGPAFKAMEAFASDHLSGTGMWDQIGAIVTGIGADLGDRESIESWNRMHPLEQKPMPEETLTLQDKAKKYNVPIEKLEELQADENKYGLPNGTLDTIWGIESSFGAHLKSPKGATGPFQFMPDTAKGMGLSTEDTYDFTKSADAAARYLSQLLRHYHGDIQQAVAAYNWGPGNVDRLGMSRAPKETQDYISKFNQGVMITQTNTITVNGSADPASTGHHVGIAINDSNSRMVRDMKSAVR